MNRMLFVVLILWIDLTPLNSPPTHLTHTLSKCGRGGSISSSSAHRKHLTVWQTLIHRSKELYSKEKDL